YSLSKKVTGLDRQIRKQKSEIVKVIKELNETYNIRLSILFKVAQIAKSVYYYWINQFSKPNKDETLIQLIKEICEESNHTYGYR
ncbi:IS3 family transposase, partial [Mammaliicoccus sciuri]|nr:IS3 family transposase [Mammaliicoccus sciuri]